MDALQAKKWRNGGRKVPKPVLVVHKRTKQTIYQSDPKRVKESLKGYKYERD